jgi:hypothetical protein
VAAAQAPILPDRCRSLHAAETPGAREWFNAFEASGVYGARVRDRFPVRAPGRIGLAAVPGGLRRARDRPCFGPPRPSGGSEFYHAGTRRLRPVAAIARGVRVRVGWSRGCPRVAGRFVWTASAARQGKENGARAGGAEEEVV